MKKNVDRVEAYLYLIFFGILLRLIFALAEFTDDSTQLLNYCIIVSNIVVLIGVLGVIQPLATVIKYLYNKNKED